MRALCCLFLLILLLSDLQAHAAGEQDSCASDTSIVIHSRIYYPVNKTSIHEDYMDNEHQLSLIKRYLSDSPHIDSITIYSYASPEGPYEFNKWLAHERGISAKQYLLKNTPAERQLTDSLIILDPTAENWDGLRNEIIDNYHLNDRDDVLAIIDQPSINDKQRKKQLRRLNGGRAWNYILKNIMPRLRYATWISVWQPIKPLIPMPEMTYFTYSFPKSTPPTEVAPTYLPTYLPTYRSRFKNHTCFKEQFTI